MIYNLGSAGASTADRIEYDNTDSGLEATNVQDAIDEVNTPATKVVKVNISATSVGASSGTSKTVTLPVHAGYKPVGVLGYYLTGDKASQTTLPNMYIDDSDNLVLYFRNITSGTISLTTASYFKILYVKQ